VSQALQHLPRKGCDRLWRQTLEIVVLKVVELGHVLIIKAFLKSSRTFGWP
jgi:hypothetical protein